MNHPTTSESFEVPKRMIDAERWRLAGERLHEISPDLFERVFALLVLSIPDDNRENITESYFLT